MELRGNIENLGTKVVFWGKMCGQVFMQWIILELLIFSLFVIDAWIF